MLLTKVTVSEDVVLDFFHLEQKSSANDNIFNNPRYRPVLNNYSRFLVTFDDGGTVASGIADVALGYNFSVYREIKDTNQLVYVAHLDEGSLSMVDYNVVNDTTYRYYVFKEDESAISEAVVSNDVTTCWWDWSLVDLIPSTTEKNLYYANPNEMWKFNLNVTSEARTQNINTTTYNNLTRFPKVSTGKMNYASGGLTCLLGNLQQLNNGQLSYVETASMLDRWNDFCANGNIKLLKDRKGNAMLVMITGNSGQTDDILREQPTTVTFNWVQVNDTTNITVIGG